MKTKLFLFFVVQGLLSLSFLSKISAQEGPPTYRPLMAGKWHDPNTWEQNLGGMWPGKPGLTPPGIENNVQVKLGHTVTIDSNSAVCNNLTIDSANLLTSSKTSPGFFSLRPGSYLTARTETPAQIVNNGTLGSATPGGTNDGISLEIPYNCNALVLSGKGSTNIYRVIPFMSGVEFERPMSFTFNQNVTTSGPFTAYA